MRSFPFRAIASLNWLLGSLLIGSAVLLPMAREWIWTKDVRDGVEKRVQDIVMAQKRRFEGSAPYLHFAGTPPDIERAAKALSVEMPVREFRFDAYSDKDNALVVRAFPAPDALSGETVPPMLYRYRIPHEGKAEGEWVALSGRKPGLSGLPAAFASLF